MRPPPSALRSYHRELLDQLLALVGPGAPDLAALNELAAAAADTICALFDGKDLLLNGQPLRGDRQLQERGGRVGAALDELGANELWMQTPLTTQDLERLAARLERGQPLQARQEQVSPRIRLRRRRATPLVELDDELEPEELVTQSCATALAALDHLCARMRQGDYEAVGYIKRTARNLVLLAERYPRLLLGFAGSRPNPRDLPALAVQSAILSLMTLRQLTRDLRNLTDLTLAALLHDVGLIRACGLMSQAASSGLVSMPSPPPQAHDRLPAASAAMMTLLGEMNESSLSRSVYAYEAHLIARRLERGLPYDGQLAPTLEGLILATTRRFLECLAAPERERGPSSLESSQIDRALESLREGVSSRLERLVISLMTRAMGLEPRGTSVSLTSGWRGVVVANHERPSCFGRPLVRLVLSPDGEILQTPRDVDLSLPNEQAAALGCLLGRPAQDHPALERARADVLTETRRRRRRAAPRIERASATETSEASDHQRQLAELESRSQIRKAPALAAAPPPAEEGHEDALTSPSDVSGPALAWDEDTGYSVRSDRIQILNAADIAHMVPEELANQDYSPPEPAQFDAPKPASLDTNPISLSPETWDQLLEEGPGLPEGEDEDDDEFDTEIQTSSDNLRILSGSFEVPEAFDPGPEDEIEATTLLPPEVVDAFQFRDRRDHETASEASWLSPEDDPEET